MKNYVKLSGSLLFFKKKSYFGFAGSSLLLGLFSSCSTQGLLSVCSVWASHCGGFSCCRAQALGHVGFSAVAPRLQSTGSIVKAHCLSCSAAYETFPDQGSNPRLLRWQMDPLPQSQQGSPEVCFSTSLSMHRN